jgi:hypothetical protein
MPEWNDNKHLRSKADTPELGPQMDPANLETYDEFKSRKSKEAQFIETQEHRMQGSIINYILRWTIFTGFMWFFVYATCMSLASLLPGNEAQLASTIGMSVFSLGSGLGNFIKPILQLGLVIFILLEAAKRLGFSVEERDKQNRFGFGFSVERGNIQAIIAIMIVIAVSISALSGIGDTGVLKDLALVVVGFYFGTRRGQQEAEAIAAGVAAGTAAATPSTLPGPPGEPTAKEPER